MPVYVPTEECLDSIFLALRSAGLTRLAGPQLLEKLNGLAVGNWPVASQSVCGELLLSPCSAALAFSLALLWPPDKWNAAEAAGKFRDLCEELQTAWVAQHTPQQKLRKTVDHAIVGGIRSRWNPAMDVLLYSILGISAPARIDRGSPIGKAIYFLRGGPASIDRIPHLDQCWGENFAEAAVYHAMSIMDKFLHPTVLLKRTEVSGVKFVWSGDEKEDWVEARPLSNVPAPDIPGDRVRAGAKRNFRMASGMGALYKNKEKVDAPIEEDRRLVLQVRDQSKAIVWLPKGNGGPQYWFGPDDEVELVFDLGTDASLEVWNCTCGSLKCDQRHRISGWDPQRLPARATFLSLLHTAVNGPLPNLQVSSFSGGMYYALLCDGE